MRSARIFSRFPPALCSETILIVPNLFSKVKCPDENLSSSGHLHYSLREPIKACTRSAFKASAVSGPGGPHSLVIVLVVLAVLLVLVILLAVLALIVLALAVLALRRIGAVAVLVVVAILALIIVGHFHFLLSDFNYRSSMAQFSQKYS